MSAPDSHEFDTFSVRNSYCSGRYESEHHAIDAAGVTGLDSLKYLLDENNMSGAVLAELLGVHASMGPKILKGERKLTANHLRKLTDRFHVEASLFL